MTFYESLLISLLPVVCYCFIQSLCRRLYFIKGPIWVWTSADLNGLGLINFGGPRAGSGLKINKLAWPALYIDPMQGTTQYHFELQDRVIQNVMVLVLH